VVIQIYKLSKVHLYILANEPKKLCSYCSYQASISRQELSPFRRETTWMLCRWKKTINPSFNYIMNVAFYFLEVFLFYKYFEKFKIYIALPIFHSLISRKETTRGSNERETGGFVMYFIQHCFICRPSDSNVSEEDAKNEPRTVASLAMAVRCSNHSARSHPQVFISSTVMRGTYSVLTVISSVK
jgi:hypothetical protein